MSRNTILIADDNPVHRRLMSEVLPHYIDADVLTASCGRQALEILSREEHNVALLLLDVHMPDCDGVEVIIELAERACLTGIVIVGAWGTELLAIETLARAYGLNVIAAVPISPPYAPGLLFWPKRDCWMVKPQPPIGALLINFESGTRG